MTPSSATGLEAAGVSVRALEWTDNVKGGASIWTGELAFGTYYVAYDEGNGWRAFMRRFLSDFEDEIAYGDKASVLAAAQADYTARIMSALSISDGEGAVAPFAWAWKWASGGEWRLFGAETSEAARADFIRDMERTAPIVVKAVYDHPAPVAAQPATGLEQAGVSVKPCPGCGRTDKLGIDGHDFGDIGSGKYAMACEHCGWRGPVSYRIEDVRARWNRRAAPDGEGAVASDLLEDLERGVVATGMHEDNSTELFDIDGASETMWEAAQFIRKHLDHPAPVAAQPAEGWKPDLPLIEATARKVNPGRSEDHIKSVALDALSIIRALSALPAQPNSSERQKALEEAAKVCDLMATIEPPPGNKDEFGIWASGNVRAQRAADAIRALATNPEPKL